MPIITCLYIFDSLIVICAFILMIFIVNERYSFISVLKFQSYIIMQRNFSKKKLDLYIFEVLTSIGLSFVLQLESVGLIILIPSTCMGSFDLGTRILIFLSTILSMDIKLVILVLILIIKSRAYP